MLSVRQKKLISIIDEKVRAMLVEGIDDVTLVTALSGFMAEVREMVNELEWKDLERYCLAFDGFATYLNALESSKEVIPS